jgi:hypothetical protein
LHPSSISLWSCTLPELPPLPAHFLPIKKESNERMQPLLSPQYSFYLLYRSHLDVWRPTKKRPQVVDTQKS